MLEFLGPFVIGVAGSLHCVGMCGPLVMAYSLQIVKDKDDPDGLRASFFHHLMFHLGRLNSYMLLGAVSGIIAQLVNLQVFMGQLRAYVSLLGGTLLLFMGLDLMVLVPLPARAREGFGSTRWVSRWLDAKNIRGRFALGMGSGFLPCVLPWSMMVKGASSSGILESFLIMFLFGLGTVPALVILGVSTTKVSYKLRLAGERIAALGVMVMGGVLLYEGAKALFNLGGVACCNPG